MSLKANGEIYYLYMTGKRFDETVCLTQTEPEISQKLQTMICKRKPF